MKFYTFSFALLCLFALPNNIAGQAPRRLRVNGAKLQNKPNHRRQNLLRVEDIHKVQDDRAEQEKEKLVIDDEDELLWDRFLAGRQASFDPSPPPTSNANTAPPTPVPTAAPSLPQLQILKPRQRMPTRLHLQRLLLHSQPPLPQPEHQVLYHCTAVALIALKPSGTHSLEVSPAGRGLYSSLEWERQRKMLADLWVEMSSQTNAARATPTLVMQAVGMDQLLRHQQSHRLLQHPLPFLLRQHQQIPPPSPAATAAPTPSGGGNVIPVSRCGCPDCGSAVLNQAAGDFTCVQRIDFLIATGESETDACRIVAGTEFGEICGACDPTTCNGAVTPTTPPPTVSPAPTPSPKCGCNSCDAALNLNAGGSSCGERIDFLIAQGQTEEAACTQIADVEFPFLCGPSCSPTRCDGQNPPLEPETPIYCFPEYENRLRFENMWGDFTVEAKEDEVLGVCAPSFNKFTSDTVSRNGDELTMRYRKNGEFWEASEVRVVMPQDKMPFEYGTFSWSIKSIKVIDADTGIVRQNHLPPSLVFGMFTWDATEDFTVNENWNHEVDIELGRFGDANNPNDAQFLVQPYTEPTNMYRFSTQDENGDFQQASQQYSFTWNPGFITWETTAGGGTDHFYSTEQAITLNEEDYIQCLPADLEIRMNLWNLDGSLVAPLEMSDNEIVEVVIDNFTYTPTNATGVEDGGYCTRDCQCEEGSQCTLGINRCTPLVPDTIGVDAIPADASIAGIDAIKARGGSR